MSNSSRKPLKISFHKPLVLGSEQKHFKHLKRFDTFNGSGYFNRLCSKWLEKHYKCPKAFLTPSCTAALEMALMLIDLKPKDEVIVPSYTFSSTANAVILHGGVPVFIDIHMSNCNLNETLIEKAINERTKAIIPVHYAGVGCNMDVIMHIAKVHHLWVIEDSAQAINAFYKSSPIGVKGHMSALSFHDTKNIHCGEGGALIINDPSLIQKAFIVKDKGTNRYAFFQGKVNKYSWQAKGSSYLMSELQAAFLMEQLKNIRQVTCKRLKIWNLYNNTLKQFNLKHITLPNPPTDCQHNAHLYYLLFENEIKKQKAKTILEEFGIQSATHYQPLHSSKAGKYYGKVSSSMSVTNHVVKRLLRLPLYYNLSKKQITLVQNGIRHLAKIL